MRIPSAVVSLLYPDVTTPNRMIEYLIGAGLLMIGKAFEDDPYLELLDLMGLGISQP